MSMHWKYIERMYLTNILIYIMNLYVQLFSWLIQKKRSINKEIYLKDAFLLIFQKKF